jgi:hypothetical protein
MATNVQRPLEWMRFDPVQFLHLIDDLSLEQVGLVTKLMLKLWQFGPMSDADVRRVCRSSFDVIRERMSEVDGSLSFEMVEEARTYGKRRQAQTIEAGKASAVKRSERSTQVERPFNERSTNVLSMSVSSIQERNERAGEGFEDFYATYPLKKSKADALKAWAKLKPQERSMCKAAIEAQVKAMHFRGKDGNDYIPHPSTWLNARRWEDEIVAFAAPAQSNGKMSRDEAFAAIEAIRKKHGIKPNGPVESHWIPDHIRQALI